MTVHWSDEVQEILDGDHALMLAYATPAKGVVLLPVSNFAVLDRAAGVVSSVNTSVGAWKKLERIRRNPRVALAFHTPRARRHRPAGVRPRPRHGVASARRWRTTRPRILDVWERFEPWADQTCALEALAARVRATYRDRGRRSSGSWCGRTWDVVARWRCMAPRCHRIRRLRRPSRRRGPLRGSTTAARPSRAARLPHALLGWVGADGFPLAVPVEVAGSDDRGILLDAAEGLVPPGGRRAGLTAHWFSRGVIGQDQRKHTGWLEAGEQLVYAPHTQSNYRFPALKPLFKFVSGAFTRLGVRGARRAGFAP